MKWKTIPDFENYLVSDTGEIWSNIKNRKLSQWEHQNGYMIIDLTKDGKRYHKRVHRLALMAFVGNPSKGKEDCNHKDGNKTNNNFDNLEWVSRSENLLHKHRVLKRRSGRARNKHPITNKQIAEMRTMHRSKMYTLKQIREKFNIAKGTLDCILYRCGAYKDR